MNTVKKFKTFTIENTEYKVYEPTLEDQKGANKVRNTAFAEAIESKAPLRAQLATLLEQNGVWDKGRIEKSKELTIKLDDAEKRLSEGGFSLDEARQLALDMSKWRAEKVSLRQDVARLDNNTAEGQADNAAFNYLVSACTVYIKEGAEVKYFKNLDDYLEKSSDEVAYTAASNLMKLMYDVENFDKTLPENKFLLDFNFVDDKLRFINEDGKFTDIDGKLVDEEGYYLDSEGKRIDKEGKPIVSTNDLKVEFKGFIKNGKTVYNKEDLKPVIVVEPVTTELIEEQIVEPVLNIAVVDSVHSVE
jgi:hypothetical protein